MMKFATKIMRPDDPVFKEPVTIGIRLRQEVRKRWDDMRWFFFERGDDLSDIPKPKK